MSKRQSLMLFGVFTLILPFLGFPNSWKNILFVIDGLLIIAVAYKMANSVAGGMATKKNQKETLPFTEYKREEKREDINRNNTQSQ